MADPDVPNLMYRPACEDSRHEGCKAIDKDKTNQTIRSIPGPLTSTQNSNVEKQNGSLNQEY